MRVCRSRQDLTFQYPCSPQGGRGGLWSAEAKLPPTLKLTLQHSKHVRVRLPSPTMWARGWG
jgi:hypothetical protein